MPAADGGVPPPKPDPVAPDEPPGIEPLPAEPPRPALPETEPLLPGIDEPGRAPDECPAPGDASR